MKKISSSNGITLVEVFVSVTIVSFMLIVIGFSIQSYVSARKTLLANTKALYLAEEGQEILRAIRDDDWNDLETLTQNTPQYISLTSTTYGITNVVETIDTNYIRSFVVKPVYRNVQDDIVPATTVGATIDGGSLEIEVRVVGPGGTAVLKSILTNLHAV
jgi:type II secretory pathway pseudopilin PulG